MLPEVFANSVVVVVGDDGDVEVVSKGEVGNAGGDGGVECVGAEEADGSVAGLGGDEGVGDALADQQLAWLDGARRHSPREPWVRGERGGGVVVLAVSGSRFERSCLDVADLAVDVEGWERGSRAGPVWDSA